MTDTSAGKMPALRDTGVGREPLEVQGKPALLGM